MGLARLPSAGTEVCPHEDPTPHISGLFYTRNIVEQMLMLCTTGCIWRNSVIGKNCRNS